MIKFKKGVIFRLFQSRKATTEISKEFFMQLLHAEKFFIRTTPRSKYAEFDLSVQNYDKLVAAMNEPRLERYICIESLNRS